MLRGRERLLRRADGLTARDGDGWGDGLVGEGGVSVDELGAEGEHHGERGRWRVFAFWLR